jgi:hypothetical protein
MPTGNEFTDIRFGSTGDQSYKQTDGEMSGGVDPRMTGPDGPSSPGSYPRTFDREAGSEPLPTEGEVYYPQRVFEQITCTGPGQSYVTTSREQVSGEYGQCDGQAPGGPYPGTDMVPSPTPSKQFSSKMSGDPKELLNSARQGVESHADLMHLYGYNQPVATLGSHPWLRDGLVTPDEREPGNAEPSRNYKIPRSMTVKPPMD